MIINEHLTRLMKTIKTKTASKISESKISTKSKGKYGHYIESNIFYEFINLIVTPAADFDKIGVDVKVTPYKINEKWFH